MDLSSLELTDKDTKRLEILHPGTGEKLPDVWIEALPLDSPGYRRAQREAIRKRMEDESRPLRPDGGQIEREQTEDIALAIVAWNGIGIDGKDVRFSIEAATSIMMRLPWLRAQLEAFLRKRANFLPSGSAGSEATAAPSSN